ncbi:MAG: PilN domain-containing protein [Candidatus Firestonebacteria bacterium]
MDKFRINLLGNKNTRFESMVFLISFFILAISMCFNAKSYIELNNKKNAYKSELEKIEPQYKQKVSLDNFKNEVTHINNLLNIRSFLWSNFLSNLEKVTPSGISISTVTPAFVTREVRIEGTALSTNILVGFMKNLQNSSFFANIFIEEQREVELKEVNQKLIGFSLTFKYNEKK